MAIIFAVLANLILLYIDPVSGQGCPTDKCESQLNSTLCLDIGDMEDLDCKTYTCLYDSGIGHGILELEPNQEQRCQIDGQCYGVGSGPNLCAFCAVDDNGEVDAIPGCLVGETCHPVGSLFDEGCCIKMCSVEHNAVSVRLVASEGCEVPYNDRCYSEGEEYYDMTCNECTRNPETNLHEWQRECRDYRIEKCFEEGAIHDIYCRTFICGNRGGIGWSLHSGTSCAASEYDCIMYNTTSPRDGYCYSCDSPNGGAPSVTCLSDCGDCVKQGESVQCNGETFTCGTVVDPPTEDEIECKVGDQTLKLGEFGLFQCNYFECTVYGLMQSSTRCFHQGQCFEGGHLIDADTCLRCFSDGKTAHVEQGCKFNDQCYSEGMTVRQRCRNKVCAKIGNDYTFVESEFQPTPCRCYDKCYPLGEFVYGNNQLCADCKANGTIQYACRLSNGDCLLPGQEEAVPSVGCYRMRCEYTAATRTYRLFKAPGQPHRCSLPDNSCLDEGETRVVFGKTYSCLNGACAFMNTSIPVGETYSLYCHEFGCREIIDGNKKTLQTYVAKYGCEVGGSCKNLNDEYEKNCNIYKCGMREGRTLAGDVLVKQRCTCFAGCMELGEKIWSQQCNKLECMSDYTMQVVERGCKSDVLETCLKINQTVTYEGQTITCVDQTTTNTDNSATTETPDSSGNTGGNSGGGTNQDYVCNWGSLAIPLGSTADKDCNTVSCEQRGQTIGLFITGTPRCKMIGGGGEEICFDAGTSKYCIACKVNAGSGFPFPEPEGCLTDSGSCVPFEEEVDYRCGRYRCDTISRQMVKVSIDKCRAAGVCIEEGSEKPVPYQGNTYRCTCVNVQTNEVQCVV